MRLSGDRSDDRCVSVMGISKFERFFRSAAGLHVDKDDLKRYSDFVNEAIYRFLLIAQATARANDRGIIEPYDLPVTKGLQENMHKFRSLDEEIEMRPILEHLAARPQLDLLYSEQLEARLPEFVGGLSLALAGAFKIIDPKLVHPSSEHWERAFELFSLLM
jgi:hypothetical protein